MIVLLTQFGDSSSGIGALGLNLQAFLIQLGTFVIAFLILRKWAFKPILKLLRERRETIDRGVQLGERMQKEQAELEAKVTKALGDARKQADEVVAEAHAQAREMLRDGEEKARERVETIISGAQDKIRQDTLRARQQLEKEMIGLIAEATEAVTGQKVDAAKDAALINKALKEQA